MKTIETHVYNFDELSDKAKEKARDWFREGIGHDSWYDYIYEDAERIAGILGITFKSEPYTTVGGQTRYNPAIYFSGFWSQGDGARFEGSYEYAKNSAKKIRSYAPTDAELHRIADGLQAVQKNNRYRLSAKVEGRNRYSHSRSAVIDVFTGDGYSYADGDTAEVVAELLRAFMDWIYAQLQTEWEYQNSDEAVNDGIRANEYTFTETGERFG